MGDQPNHSLRPRHSYSMQASKHSGHAKNVCKSEMCVVPKQQTNNSRQLDIDVHSSFEAHGEYYKKYEHDEVPVKDSNLKNIPKIRDKGSLTNSELDKLESKIFKNMSQELHTDDDNSKSSLESNIKFFKTTVLEIFDNFYASMRDFELYKRRFNEILEKNKEDAVADMEEFIKDMIQHIMSSETLLSSEGRKTNDLAALSVRNKEIMSIAGRKANDQASLSLGDKEIQHIMSSETLLSSEGRKTNDLAALSVRNKEIMSIAGRKANDQASLSLGDKEILNDTDVEKSTDLASLSFRDKQTNVSTFDDKSSYDTNTSAVENLHSVVEAYKNDHYLTDSTLDDNLPKDKTPPNKDEIFNIFLLSGNPCVQIKINDRNLLSEINIKEPVKEPDSGKHVASAENMQRLAAKKMELEKYVNVEQDHDSNVPDREIPVKVSYAKKNIYLDEDFSQERDTEKSFITKLCNFLCKKFRKNS